jgi:hypothetical protein
MEIVPPGADFDRANVVAVVAYEATGASVKYKLPSELRTKVREFWSSGSEYS